MVIALDCNPIWCASLCRIEPLITINFVIANDAANPAAPIFHAAAGG